ncbi:DUF1643 domain-containing protein [Virgibacillus sp. DJP39]|uniref:DUF1643 domain-containing protein n=1 Tax=Virgibacillus sp. DJP39 TaxID=3409790 RepID=UPI003BB4B8BF
MSFTPALELRKRFYTEGAFYQLDLSGLSYICRGLAKVSRKGVTTVEADALFVLLNPGSCRPADSDYQLPTFNNQLDRIPLVQAETDPTQYQIMRLMDRMQWNMVYIINLSDLRAGSVKDFKASLDNFESHQNETHSIFSLDRKENIHSLLSKETKLIAGWGINPLIKNRACHALTYLTEIGVHGLPHVEHPFYYHPYPMIKEKCIKWLENISEKLAEEDVNDIKQIEFT